MFASHVTFIPILLLHAGLGVFVLLRNPANTINKRFCIFTLAISLWIFFIFFLLQTREPDLAAFRLKLVFFSPHIVVSVSFVKQLPQARYGCLFPVFWLYFIACMAYSLYSLYRKSVRYYGIKRLQVQYLYFGVAASVFLGVITNFLLPTIGIWQNERFVPFMSVPIPLSVAYAIVKYHLMDISVVIKRSTVYAALSVVLSIIYFAVGLIMSSILPVSEYKETITNMVSAIVMVLTFVPIRELIQHVIEKTLFHTRYSHPKILSDSTVMFSSIHDLNGLLHYSIQHLYDSVGIDKICILLQDETTQHYSLKAAINFPSD